MLYYLLTFGLGFLGGYLYHEVIRQSVLQDICGLLPVRNNTRDAYTPTTGVYTINSSGILSKLSKKEWAK